ncbi:hypothetical protein NDU88_002611 [Pleurodeles waltl]|uniref:Uncharacterized protein n=1 Tax=Pleurodeles waltl TaxID=8319 RepID=A0AAV7T3T9_PLEWA|nr:hypothetical protein NDU88_002611 [Pleurodeles waltl]
MLQVVEQSADLPIDCPVRRGGVRFARRSGASFRQRVAAVGRGSLPADAVTRVGPVVACGEGLRTLEIESAHQAAISAGGRAGVSAVGAHASKRRRALKYGSQRSPLAVESEVERLEPVSKERTLEGAANMAAPRRTFDIFEYRRW